MKGRRSLIIALTAAVSLFFAINAGAETEAGKGMAKNKFMGTVKEADCKTGELKLSGMSSGEAQFKLTDKTEFKYIKGCEDIKKEGRAIVEFSDSEGVKTATLIKYREAKSREAAGKRDGEGGTSAAGRRDDIYMGWVGSVDCEKGALTLQKIDDRSKTETFALDKETGFSGGITGCGDIKTDLILAISFDNKGGDKVVKTLKSMIAPSAPGRR